jgi:hypothetical protein
VEVISSAQGAAGEAPLRGVAVLPPERLIAAGGGVKRAALRAWSWERRVRRALLFCELRAGEAKAK